MIINLDGGTKLDFFRDLYNLARMQTEELIKKQERYYKQYKGDRSIDTDDESAIAEDAKQVRNITYELIESQVTSYIPVPKVSPEMYNEKNERNAKSIEVMLKSKRNKLPFEKLNDIDERYNPIYGGSVWLIEWDNTITTHNTVGDIRMECLSPKRFTPQPFIYDINEMEYCFIQFETTKEDIMRKYGVSIEVAEEAENDEYSTDDNTATLYVCYYKNDDGKVCQYIWSADTEISDIDDYYARKIKKCEVCGKREEICQCEKPKLSLIGDEFEYLERDIVTANGVVIPAMTPIIKNGEVVTETVSQTVLNPDGSVAMEDVNGVMMPKMVQQQVPKLQQTKLPYYTPNRFPIVIRKNTSEEDNLYGQSDCEFIRPQQQGVNKLESRIMEKILKGGVYIRVPEHFNENLDDSVLGRIIRCNPNEIAQFGTIDLVANIQQDIAQSERMYDQAKRTLGISDSFQGQSDNTAQSGKAKQLQINQSAGRLDSKRQNKNAAYADIDHVIFQYYLAYSDEPRPAPFKDSHGRWQNVEFNRYDFLEIDDNGEWYYNDSYLFACDNSIDFDKDRETLWQENTKNFQSGAYGNPQDIQTLLIFWENMEKLHYPFARENVERFTEQLNNLLAQQQAQIQQQQTEIANRKGYENYLNEQISKGGRS